MTNTVFPTFQTQYILHFSSAKPKLNTWILPNTEIFQSKEVASATGKGYIVITLNELLTVGVAQ
jgi:hypothetical protein